MSSGVFEPTPSQLDFPKMEQEIRAFWKSRGVYHRSLEQRRDAPAFVFYEGPPTANGLPHPGHCLTRTIKDVFPRYKTMAGYRCERKAGWDTHGLPVEIEVCKDLGILDGGKAAIEAMGIERFNRICLESVFRYTREWEELTERIGFWVDMEDAYVTFHQPYVESVWWALKQLFDQGLLYQGSKVVWWWAQGGTALSAGEVGEGYRDTDDPAITVKLRLTPESVARLGLPEDSKTSLLVWTTTPWTLSSNCAAAVGADIDYVLVDSGDGECVILAEPLAPSYYGEKPSVQNRLKGQDLVGLAYEPLFHYDTPSPIVQSFADDGNAADYRYWEVIAADFVALDQGTGIVHLAPAFGEDDHRACIAHNMGFLCFVQPDGTFDERVTDEDPFDGTPIAGRFCKDADKSIIRVLKERGLLVKHEQYRHPYPFCPRADKDPLIQYARKSWFIRTQQFKDQFLANNARINWMPDHIRDGRFGKFLDSNVDWALSRERFWGTPLPIWVCERTGHAEAIGSYEELLAKPDVQGTEVWAQAKAASPELSEHLKVHKPYIDAVTYRSPKDPDARMRRVPEVIDVWFDSGCMPFAQWGYPHAPHSKERFKASFPANFISEAIDQTRGWFYSLLSISTMVFKDAGVPFPHPFENCICLGLLLGEDGEKLSKSKKNYTDPKVLFDKYGADAMRWSLLAGNPPTTSITFSERQVEEAIRELLIRWGNVYSFFVIYANLDGFNPAEAPAEVKARLGLSDDAEPESEPKSGETRAAYRPAPERGRLDAWIISEMHRTTAAVRDRLDHYDTYPAARAVSQFVDALSTWYVRRSRQRFWANEWSQDKADAYWTLYECLLTLARLAAPFTPFFSDLTWRNLACSPFSTAAESVHLTAFPEAVLDDVDEALVSEMRLVREAVSLGLNVRRTEGIKVRQPLAECEVIVADAAAAQGIQQHFDLVRDELNVKTVNLTDHPEQYVQYELVPNFKALGPKFGKKMPAIKKALATSDGAALYRQMQEGHVTIEVDGEPVTLGPDEVEARLTAKDGFAAASSKQLAVVLTTAISDALREEGWVREFVHTVQNLRKEQGLAYNDRIDLRVHSANGGSLDTVSAFQDYIAGEVLAAHVGIGERGDGDGKAVTIEGTELTLWVGKI